MPRYLKIGLIGCALILAITLLLSGNLSEDSRNASAFEDHYAAYSLLLPPEVTFAGEAISLNDADISERYDRELLTNIYWQSQTLLFIKRAHKYFPVIEKILKEQNIPDDFKYLAIAESGLQFGALSPSNAASYWQFLDKTGKTFGLEINEFVDERYNLEKATAAACNYFQMSYARFGSWALVAASYNMGIDGLQRQLQQQGVSQFADLYLNPETSRYLFRIMSIKTIIENPEQYGFHIPYEQLYKPVQPMMIRVDTTIPDLAKYALNNKSNYKWLKLMNPWLRNSRLPVAEGKTYFIQLPKQQMILNSYLGSISSDTINLRETNYLIP